MEIEEEGESLEEKKRKRQKTIPLTDAEIRSRSGGSFGVSCRPTVKQDCLYHVFYARKEWFVSDDKTFFFMSSDPS